MHRTSLWVGRVCSGFSIVFLALDGGMKLFHAGPSVETMAALGYADGSLVIIGSLELVATALYAFPRTARIGAILLTGFLGGAVATNLRVNAPLLSHVLFPVYLGGLFWIGLLLRRRANGFPIAHELGVASTH